MGNEATRSTPTADLQLLRLQQQEAIMALTLPQPELPMFTGDPIKYCDFIRAFENQQLERKALLYFVVHERACTRSPSELSCNERRRRL